MDNLASKFVGTLPVGDERLLVAPRGYDDMTRRKSSSIGLHGPKIAFEHDTFNRNAKLHRQPVRFAEIVQMIDYGIFVGKGWGIFGIVDPGQCRKVTMRVEV